MAFSHWLSLGVSGAGVLRWAAFVCTLEIRGQCISPGNWAEHSETRSNLDVPGAAGLLMLG